MYQNDKKITKIKMYMLKTLNIRIQYWRNDIWLTLNLRTYETNMIEILVTKQKEREVFWK